MKSSVKFEGGSVMAFGMILTVSTGPFLSLHSKINATAYKETLKKHVRNLKTAINQPTVFMHDNPPCLTAKSFGGEHYCYGVACSRLRHEFYWEFERKIGENIR